MWSDMATAIGDDYTLQVEQVVYTIDSTNGQPTASASVTSSPVSGADSIDPLPGNVNGVVRLSTPLFVAGRQLQGRLWVPGPTENNNTNGKPTSTYQSFILAAVVDNIVTPANGLVIFSRTHHTFDAVTSASIWNQWGSLRSRRS